MHRRFAAIAFLMVTVQAHGQLIEQEQQGVCPPLTRSKYGGESQKRLSHSA